jgi:predicted nucleic acid-binding Zn ribbon protein
MARTETTYDVKCLSCGDAYEIAHPMAESHPPCRSCGDIVETQLGAVAGRVAVKTGPIYDMRQVKDSHGVHWRETPGSDMPGGCGRKAFSSPGLRPGCGASKDKLPKGTWR